MNRQRRETLTHARIHGRGAVKALQLWWTGRGQYWWVIDYYRSRSTEGTLRWFLVVCAGLLGFIAVLMLFSSAAPASVPGRAWVIVAATTFEIAAVLLACRGWPTPAVSVAVAVLSDVAITTVAWQFDNHFVSLSALNALFLPSLYIAFFHGPRLLTLHMAWAMAALTCFALRAGTGPYGDAPTAVAHVLTSMLVVVAAPATIQLGFWLVRADVDRSQIDALTGLLNRRGLYDHVEDLVHLGHPPDTDLVVMLLDIDEFKSVNDTYGHAIGDTVLIRTARGIESVVRSSALLARTGGEEFVLVDTIPKRHAAAVADRIRRALAAPAQIAPTTVSIGVSSVPGADLRDTMPMTVASLLDELIARADRAMYRAKQLGRNCIATDFTHTETPTAATSTATASPTSSAPQGHDRQDRRRGGDRRRERDRRSK